MNLRERLAAAMKRAQDLAGFEELTEEQEAEFKAATDEVEEIRGLIAKKEARDSSFAALTASAQEAEKRLAQPASKPVDGGNIPAAEASFVPVNPYTRQQDFFADVVRATTTHDVPARLIESQRMERSISIRAAAGANENIPADGGFIVPTDFVNQIIDSGTNAGAAIMPLLNPLPVAGNGIIVPRSNDYDKSAGKMGGGIQAFWDCEAADRAESSPKFDQLSMRLNGLTVLVPATQELLDDAAALGAWIAQRAPEAIVWKIEDSVVNGPGNGQPLGFLNSGCLVTVAKVAGQGADTIVAGNIDAMYAALTANSMMNAVWLANQSCLPQLLALADSAGNRLWLPNSQMVESPHGSIYGRPLKIVEYNPLLGEAGDISLVDMSQYASIDKGSVQTAESIHVYFKSNQKLFRFIYRYDGQPEPADKTTLKGSLEVSPFVTLAERT